MCRCEHVYNERLDANACAQTSSVSFRGVGCGWGTALPGSKMQCFACVCRPDGDLVRYPIRSPLNSTKERTETVVMILGPPFIGMVMTLSAFHPGSHEDLSCHLRPFFGRGNRSEIVHLPGALFVTRAGENIAYHPVIG